MVVFLRTNKDSSSGGHPVDRVQLDDQIQIEFDGESYSSDHHGFLQWSGFIDSKIKIYLTEIFSNVILFGMSKPYNDLIDNQVVTNGSELHAIRVDDIRNIVVLEVEETKQKFFEELYEISL